MATQTRSRPSRTAKTRQPTTPKPKPERSGPDPNQWASISTLAPERPYVTIDDHRHPYRLMQDFGSIEHREFQRYSDEFTKLLRSEEEPTDEEEARYDWLLDWLFDHVLMDVEKLRAQLDGISPETGEPVLTGGIKYEIVTTFTEAPARAIQNLGALAQILQEAQARDESSL